MPILSEWFIAASIGMCSFACMALLLKKLSYSVPSPVVLLYLFTITALLYFAYSTKKNLNIALSWQSLAFIALASIFAFVGNLGDVEALRLAPNPGYASAVKAGQIIVITFAAYLLFPDQKLTAQGLLGVGLVFSGIALLALQK